MAIEQVSKNPNITIQQKPAETTNQTGSVSVFNHSEVYNTAESAQYEQTIANSGTTNGKYSPEVQKKIDEFLKDEDVKKVLEKYPQLEDILIQHFVDSNCSEYFLPAVKYGLFDVINGQLVLKDIPAEKVLGIIDKTFLCQYAGSPDIDYFNKSQNTERKGLYQVLNLDKNADEETVLKALGEHLSNIKDAQELVAEIIRLTENSNIDERKQIAEFFKNIGKYPETEKVLKDADVNYSELFNVVLSCAKDSQEYVSTITGVDLKQADKSLIDNIANADNEKIINEICDKYGITKERYEEIEAKLKENPSYIDECTPKEQEFIKEVYPELKDYGVVSGVAIGLSSFDNKEELEAKLHNAYKEHLGESAHRDVLTGIYRYVEENGEKLGLPANFADIMDKATNGNYSVVVGDIQRDDGTTTPLNMDLVNFEESSAYNTEQGGFNTTATPEQILLAQNNLSNLKADVKAAEDKEPAPRYIKKDVQTDENGSDNFSSSALYSASDFQAYRDSFSSTTVAAMNILSGKVKSFVSDAGSWAIGVFKIMDKHEQSDAIVNSEDKYTDKLINKAKQSAIAEFSENGKKAGSFEKTKHIQELAQKMQEKENI